MDEWQGTSESRIDTFYTGYMINRKWGAASIFLAIGLLLTSPYISAAGFGLAEDYLGLGNKAYTDGKYEEALAAYDKAIAINPDQAGVWYNKGTTLDNLGRYAEAVAAYDKAIAVKPDFLDAWNNKGNALNKLERFKEAIAAYDNAIAIKPDSDIAWSNKGIVLGRLKRYDDAIAAYSKAIEISPNTSDAYYNLACIYSLKKEKSKALEYLKAAIDKGYTNLKYANEDRDLDFIRDTPEYQQMVNKPKPSGTHTPVIARFYGIVIKMYFSQGDRGVPHFHAIYGESNAVFAVQTLEIIEGDLPDRAQQLVEEWAGQYHNELLEMWNRQESRQLPGLE